MHAFRISSLAVLAAGTILAGCATAPGPNTYASAPASECKMVRLDSASQSIHMAVHGNQPTPPIAESEGEFGVAKTLVPPVQPAFRAPADTGISYRAMRDC